MNGYRIPFNKPSLAGSEMKYMAQAVENGHLSGDGPFSRKCHAWLERTLNVPRALLTTSCTHALEMAAFLLDLQPGDEVIVPAFTFVSTVNAFAIRGARPVFADVRPDTFNIDESGLEALVTSRTRAIIVVHYAGIACNMDAILQIAGNHGLPVIEDNAHGLFGRYRGRLLGTFGVLATLSFHETKNITCGEGGALLINAPAYIERAEILREKGTNRSRFFRGQVDKYTWVDLGSSYLPSDVLAAFLFAQLEEYQAIQARRAQIWQTYLIELASWAETNSVRLPVIPPDCEHPSHLFYLLLPSLAERQAFIRHLQERNILAVFHYLPLHISEMGLRYGGRPGDCPVAEDVSERLVRLPLYNQLAGPDQSYVIESIQAYRPSNQAVQPIG